PQSIDPFQILQDRINHMVQKVHPIGSRLVVVKEHSSLWYANPKDYAGNLVTDLKVREYLFDRLKNASVSSVKIERPSENVRITIATARPEIGRASCRDRAKIWVRGRSWKEW